MEQDDAALLVAICEGSERAFNQLIDRHQQAVRVFLRRVVGDADADDVAQETFLAAWTQAGSYRGGAPVRCWLFGIAWRRAKDLQRAGFRRRERDMLWHEEPGGGGEPDAVIGNTLERAMAELPMEQRAAVTLCLAYDFSHSEAAGALHLPLGTVKSHVTRGRERLRVALGEQT